MIRPTHPRKFRVATLGALLVLLISGLNAVGATLPSARLFSIKPAATWVGIARVYLEIGDLQQAGELLEGTYRIRVPMAPGQNDTGRVKLRAPGPLDQLDHNDATVFGNAMSSTGQIHDIIARIQPNGVVRIDVITPVRTLRFKSTYTSR